MALVAHRTLRSAPVSVAGGSFFCQADGVLDPQPPPDVAARILEHPSYRSVASPVKRELPTPAAPHLAGATAKVVAPARKPSVKRRTSKSKPQAKKA